METTCGKLRFMPIYLMLPATLLGAYAAANAVLLAYQVFAIVILGS